MDPESSSSGSPRPSSRPEWLDSGRIPSLDGLRAVSVLLVIVHHVSMAQGYPVPESWHWLTGKGAVGVDIFFAISGFLITTLLLREHQRMGRTSLRGFYTRRAIRIFPPFAAYLLFVAVLCFFGIAAVPSRDWLGAVTYTINFIHPAVTPVGHIWSLSVEEHFYLAWPLLFVVLGPRRAGSAALICLMAEPLIRWVTNRFTSFDIDFVTFTRLDSIAAGCLLAIVGHYRPQTKGLALLESRPATAFAGALGGLLLSLFVLRRSGFYTITIGPTVEALCICSLMWLAARFDSLLFGRVLNGRVLSAVGKMSYSLYLWQQVFLLNGHSNWWPGRFPQNLLFSLLGATASYYLIEAPANRLKDRLGRTRHGDVAPRSSTPQDIGSPSPAVIETGHAGPEGHGMRPEQISLPHGDPEATA